MSRQGNGTPTSRKRPHEEEEDSQSRTPRTRQRAMEEEASSNNGGHGGGSQQRKGLNLAPLSVPNRSNEPIHQDDTAMFEDEDGEPEDDDEEGGSHKRGGGNVRGCRCGRSKCLKQYCQCFRNDIRCDPEHCMCSDCHNDGRHEKQRINAIRRIRRNKVGAFKGTALEITETEVTTPGGTVKQARGCRCMRSRCQKKYCECFGAGLACTTNCVCVNCANGNERSPVAEDLIVKPQFRAQVAHAVKPAENKASAKADGRHQQRAAAMQQKQQQQQEQQQQLHLKQEEQMQQQRKRRKELHQNNEPQQPYRVQDIHNHSSQGPSSSTMMPAPTSTPTNLYHKKRPNMFVQVPNPPLQTDAVGFSAGSSMPPDMLASQQDEYGAPMYLPSGRDPGIIPASATPKGLSVFDSARQESQNWDQDLYSSGGGLRSDGSMGGLYNNSPRTRSSARLQSSQSQLQLQREASDASFPGLWSASGVAPSMSRQASTMMSQASDTSFGGGSFWSAGGGTGLRRSLRGPGGSTADFTSMGKNSPLGSPVVSDSFWGSVSTDLAAQDPEGILSDPGSARAWTHHIPGPQRESSGLSMSGRM